MDYCPNCGYKILQEDLFCGNCGFSLSQIRSKSNSSSGTCKGIIFTDTLALATKLRVSLGVVCNALKNYINKVASQITYELLDYSNASSSSLRGCYDRNTRKDWLRYHKFLYSKYSFLWNSDIEYLFIIGSDDIIPMPLFQNFIPGTDGVVSSDILYGYFDMISQSVNLNTVFKSSLRFHIGRLPLSTDATFDQLQSYLDRSANVIGKGIPVQMVYAQCDPNWKQVSKNVVSQLSEKKLIPHVEADLQLIYNDIFLSPFVTKDNIGEAFNTYANLYYFNLHGSSVPEVSCFLGFSENDESRCKPYVAITPKSFEESLCDNIVVTEACYGGRHNGLAMNDSMLLTSMYNETLLYLGSSITAYGAVDKIYKKSACMYGADILAKEFISGLMSGYTAGEALHLARKKLFMNSVDEYKLVNMLTILEFSLYGDPFLTALFPNSSKEKEIVSPEYSSEIVKNDIQVEVLYQSAGSVLSLVRNKVNHELQEISNRIQEELVGLGMQPRKLLSVFHIKYGSIAQHMFCYQTEGGISPLVAVNEYNNKKVIIMPKVNNAISHISVDYRNLYREACQRFGLQSFEEEVAPQFINSPSDNSGRQRKSVLIDRRIEKKSKQQIKTFNAVLDLVYRPDMEHSDIISLSYKTCDYDFSLLINPLCILLETELKQSVIKFLSRHVSLPKDMTFGSILYCMNENLSLLKSCGISSDFVVLLDKLRPRRNKASHSGGINEQDFLAFYGNFIKAVTSTSFTNMMELKQMIKY